MLIIALIVIKCTCVSIIEYSIKKYIQLVYRKNVIYVLNKKIFLRKVNLKKLGKTLRGDRTQLYGQISS